MDAIAVIDDGIICYARGGGDIKINGAVIILECAVLNRGRAVVAVNSVIGVFDGGVFNDASRACALNVDILPVAFNGCRFIRGKLNHLARRPHRRERPRHIQLVAAVKFNLYPRVNG